MKAIVQDRYGSADVLEFRDVEDPVVGEDDVLIAFGRRGAAPTCGTSWPASRTWSGPCWDAGPR